MKKMFFVLGALLLLGAGCATTNNSRPDMQTEGNDNSAEVAQDQGSANTSLDKQFTGPAADAAWYKVSYPSTWTASPLIEDWGTDNSFASPSGESVTITIMQRQEGLTFENWLAQFDRRVFTRSMTDNGYVQLTSDDGQTIYIDGSSASQVGAGYAAKIVHIPGRSVGTIDVFKAIVNSFKWI